MIGFILGLAFGSTAFWVGVPVVLALCRLFGLFTIVKERYCHVYVLFGKIVGCVDNPGLNFLPAWLGWRAFIMSWFGKRYVLDMRMDQCYLRSNPVNSEEGAPMGIGIWYEMFISNPLNFLFKNADPRGSLSANVCNSVVRSLSNLPLAEMLEQRHRMSQMVREDVSPKSYEWGYQLGTVYVRKVHFRDNTMIKQIEEKVVNRLRQVTAAITQDGANQVNIITSSADRQAAIEFAKAQAVRPCVVGEALTQIAKDPVIAGALFDVLETENMSSGAGGVAIIPRGKPLLAQMLAGVPQGPPTARTTESGNAYSSAPPKVVPPPAPAKPPKPKEVFHEAADELADLAEAGLDALPAYLQKIPAQFVGEAMRRLLAKKGGA